MIERDEIVTSNTVFTKVNNKPIFGDRPIEFMEPGTIAKGTILARNAAGNLAPFVIGESSPVAIAIDRVTATEPGNVQAKVLIRGDVLERRLRVAADGDDRNIDEDVRKELRAAGFTPIALWKRVRVG